MELSHLRYFFQVARARSFAHGARLSHVSAPAISKAVKKLEQELGQPLFVRTTRTVALTQVGTVLFEQCRELFARVETLEREIERASASVAGPLRIGAMEVFSIFLLPEALCRLTGRHPEMVPSSFEMLPQVMEQRLLDGELEVGFTVGGTGARGIEYRELGTSRGVLVCGRSHALFSCGRVRARELGQHPFVVPRFLGREHLPAIDQFPDERRPRRVGATIELLQMGIHMVVAGRYLGYFPEVSVREHLASGRLKAVRGVELGPPYRLTAMMRRGLPMRPAVELLVDELSRLVRS